MPTPSPAQPIANSTLDPARIQSARVFTQRVAWVLESSIPLPVIRKRVGIEPIIALFPVLGDLIGFLLTLILLVHAIRLKAPPLLLLRMAGNAVFDLFIGLVPIFGDLADFAFKANRRNAALLEKHLDRLEGKAPDHPWRRRLGTLLVVLALLASAWLALQAGAWIMGWLFG